MGSWLFGGQKVKPATSLRIQSALQGQPLALLYGRTRIAGNLIWYGDFKATAAKQGGKGGGTFSSSGKGGSSYEYSASFELALCEGPIDLVKPYGSVWVGSGVPQDISNTDFSGFTGSYAQAVWSYLASAHPDQAASSAYRGIAYVAASNVGLGSSPDLPSFTFEVTGAINTGIPGGPADANARDVIVDYLTNQHYGVGWPANRLDPANFPDYSNYTLSHGMLVSMAEVAHRPAQSFLSELLAGTNSSARWSNGKLGIVPWGDSSIAANGVMICSVVVGIPVGTTDVYTVAVGGANYLGESPSAGNGVFYYQGTQLTPGDPSQNAGLYAVDGAGNFSFSADDAGKSIIIFYTISNPNAFTANTSPVYAVGDLNWLPGQGGIGSGSANSAPLLIVRKAQKDRLNAVRVEFLDRANSYNPGIAEAKDQASIDVYGPRPSSTMPTHFFCSSDPAVLSAMLMLNRQQIANTYSFTLGPEFILVDPEDILTLTRAVMSITNKPVRIIEIQENGDGSLSFTAEDYLGTAGKPLLKIQGNAGHYPNANVDPGDINQPYVFEPPPDLLAGKRMEVWAAVSGQLTDVWGGCKVWTAYDPGGPYMLQGTVQGAARMGQLSASIPNGTATTASVNLSESAGELDSVSFADAVAFNSACFVDGEVIAYQAANLTTQFHYGLTNVQRGGYGTVAKSHANGANFARLDQGIAKLPYDGSRIGDTIYIKFQSFNIWGGGLKTLDQVSAVAYQIVGPGVPPDVQNFRATAISDTTTLAWDALNIFNLSGYEIRFTTDLTATPVGTKWGASTLVQTGVTATSIQVPTQLGTYLIKAVNTNDVYSANAAAVEMFIDPLTQRNVVQTFTQNATFTGTKTNVAIDTTVSPHALKLSNAGGGLVHLTGTYQFDMGGGLTYFDLGAVFTSRISAIIVANGNEIANTMASWDSLPNLLASVDPLAGQTDGLWSLQIMVSMTQVNPTLGTPGDGVRWTTYAPLSVGDLKARGYAFQLILNSVDGRVTPEVTGLSVTIDMPDRVVGVYGATWPSGSGALLFSYPVGGFLGPSPSPALTITVNDNFNNTLAGPAGFQITSKTLNGFRIKFLNAAGAAYVGDVSFDYIARGWGTAS